MIARAAFAEVEGGKVTKAAIAAAAAALQ